MREIMTMEAQATSKFAGFCQPEAAGRFTMVPNQFFDEIVPNEPASVTKLVGLVIRRTLGWQEADGQRRQQAQISYSEFRREMNMSNDTVAAALQIALHKGYIVKLREGRLNSKTGTAIGAFYGLAWSQADTPELSVAVPVPNHLTTQPPSSTFNSTPTPTPAPEPTQPKVAHSNSRTVVAGLAHSNSRTVVAAQSDNPTVAHSNNWTVEASLAQSDFRRDINKESFELINKVEIKRTPEPDSTFKPIQAMQVEAGAVKQSIDGAMSNKVPPPIPALPTAAPPVPELGVSVLQNQNSLPGTPEMCQRPGSVYIQNLVRDFSRDFEDADHAGPNVSQALNLWAVRGCDERDFTAFLYEARKRTRANLGPSQTTRANRMPYFFKVLRDLLQPSAEKPMDRVANGSSTV